MSEPRISEDEIQAYVDARLDPERAEALRAALGADPALRDRVRGLQADRAAMRAALAPIASEAVPERLRPEALLAANRNRAPLRQMVAGLVLFGLGLGAGWGLAWRAQGPIPAPRAQPMVQLASEAQTAYSVYAVEVAHPVEVRASERDHLMAWLSKRLGRKLAAPDLARQGYTLVGGRLLPAEQGPAAQLMYENGDGLRVTLYVTALPGGQTGFRLTRGSDGVSSLAWVDQGYGFAVSAPMSREGLWPIANAVYRQLAP